MLEFPTPHIVVLSTILIVLSIRIPMVPSAIAVMSTLSEDNMQALQVVSLGSIFSIAFLGLLYGELTLLQKR